MRALVLVSLALCASVVLSRALAEVTVADEQSKSPAPTTDQGSDPAKPAKATEPERQGAAQAGQKADQAEKVEKLVRTDEEWRELLSPAQYEVLRKKGTERPFRNKYDRHFESGVYACAACGQELFSSATKFNSGCGWPAFFAAKAGNRVELSRDVSHGMVRTEVTCARCGSHLGHVFDDAPQTPTGQRFCINSISLKFIPAGVIEKEKQKKRREEAAGDQTIRARPSGGRANGKQDRQGDQ